MTDIVTNWTDSIGMSVNASYLNGLGTAVNANTHSRTAAGAFSSRPSASTCSGSLYYCTDLNLLYLSDGSTWQKLRLNGFAGSLADPSTSGWTVLSGTYVAQSTSSDAQLLTITPAGSATLGGIYRTLSPTSNYSAQFCLSSTYVASSNRFRAGIFLRQSSDGKATGINYWYNGSTSGTLEITHWTPSQSIITTSGSLTYSTNPYATAHPNFLRIRDNGTNLYYEYSYDNLTWTSIYNESRTGFITADQVGFGGDVYSSTMTLSARSFIIV